MTKIIGASIITTCVLLAACGNSTSTATNNDTTRNLAMDTMVSKSYDASLVNNKKDPTCGMPVSAGIADTAHYEKYVLGFCSKECKDEFLKNPKAAIAAAEVK